MPSYQNAVPPSSLMLGDVGFSFNNEAFPGSAQAGSVAVAALVAFTLGELPVVEAGRVVGMLSIGDLVRAVLAEQKQTIEQLESYIHS